MKLPYLLILYCSIVMGCQSQQSKRSSLVLTPNERHWCDSLQIDSSVILQLRKHTTADIEPFHYSLSKMIEKDGTETELEPVHLQGFVLQESNTATDSIVLALSDELNKKGYGIFVLENGYGIDRKLNTIGLLKTADKYSILKQIKTDGINLDIDNDSLIRIIRTFDKKYSLQLIGASGDWCEFIIHNEPGNWLSFAKEVFKVCPDVVDQGTGTVEALAEEMQRTRRLYLWWD